MGTPHDIVIAGAGMAGLTAALTAARLGRSPLVLTGNVLGGHLLSIESIDGLPGFSPGVPGYDLCPSIQMQASEAGARFTMTEVERVERAGEDWDLHTGAGTFTARAVITATGTRFKRLGLPNEDGLAGRGVSQCASCDAPLLRDQDVVVVGGGDSAAQEALTLAEAAARVTILERGEHLTAQRVYAARLLEHPRVEIRLAAEVEAILGEQSVTGVRFTDRGCGETREVAAAGVFVFIGLSPESGCMAPHVRLDDEEAIVTDAQMRSSAAGVFAAGTVRAGATGRAAGAAGDGAAAAIAADRYLSHGGWPSFAAA